MPCSRSDVFSSKQVSMIEKRMLMKLLSFCINYENDTEQYVGWYRFFVFILAHLRFDLRCAHATKVLKVTSGHSRSVLVRILDNITWHPFSWTPAGCHLVVSWFTGRLSPEASLIAMIGTTGNFALGSSWPCAGLL